MTLPRTKMVTIVGFLAAGAANTALTIAIYQLLLFVTDAVVAYALTYATGVAFAAYAYATHVFDTVLTRKGAVRFAVFYVASGLLGTALNAALVETAGIPARIAVFVTVALLLPLNYFGSRACLATQTGRTDSR